MITSGQQQHLLWMPHQQHQQQEPPQQPPQDNNTSDSFFSHNPVFAEPSSGGVTEEPQHFRNHHYPVQENPRVPELFYSSQGLHHQPSSTIQRNNLLFSSTSWQPLIGQGLQPPILNRPLSTTTAVISRAVIQQPVGSAPLVVAAAAPAAAAPIYEPGSHIFRGGSGHSESFKSGSGQSNSHRRNIVQRRGKPNTPNTNTNRRSGFARQDSGLSDSDCSDHSGISSLQSNSGISSINSGESVGQDSRRSGFGSAFSSVKNSNRRGMYNRQDSEPSFCSSSSTVSSKSTAYSSDHSTSNQSGTSGSGSSANGKFMHSYKKPVMPPKSQYVAMDCEMVGTLTGKSVCARVVLIDWKGRTVLDQYVKPTETITDYRTAISGITAEHLKDALVIEEIRPKVHAALAGKILIGHGLNNDLECLGVEHPWHMIRDTALYEPFMKMNYGQLNPRKLKDLAQERLNRQIQMPGQAHSPTQDAMAALDLYKSHRPRWEACMNAQIKEGQRLLVEQQKQREQYEQYFAGLPILAFP